MGIKINNRGFEIIKKYEPEAELEPAHDQIYVGHYSTREQMTPEEQKEMETLNWFEDEESWSHFT